MQAQDIEDVLTVRNIIAKPEGAAAIIAALIDWRDGSLGTVEVNTGVVAPQQDHSVAENAAAAAEAKDTMQETVAKINKAETKAPPAKASAKAPAKGRAKPPPPPADDDGPSPDPSDDDF